MTKKIVDYFKKNYLYFVVFTTGVCVLVIEILATRILNPYYGSTIFSVSSILGVILAGLSLGYYYGGKLADKKPRESLFFLIIMLSGGAVALLQLIKHILLPIKAYDFSIQTGPVVFSIILFIIPAVLLGLLSPFAIRLQKDKNEKVGIGSISGKVFFASTIGSIFGSFFTGFYLIPQFGVDQILIAVALLLTLIGVLGTIKKKNYKKTTKLFLLISLVLLINFALSSFETEKIIYSSDGTYQKIYFIDTKWNNKPAVVLMLDANSSAGIYQDSNKLAFDYTKYFNLYEAYEGSYDKFLYLGGGGYNMPYALAEYNKDAYIDVVEIEPDLHELSIEYFDHSPTDNLTNHVEDGRVFLQRNDKYDFIMSDVYSSLYSIPVHFTTQEFFQLAYDKLNPNGIILVNVIGMFNEDEPSFLLSEYKTFDKIFKNNYVLAIDGKGYTGPQNVLFVGYKSEEHIDISEDKVGREHEIKFEDYLVDMSQYDLSEQLILTDNYAPIENLNVQMYEQLRTY